MRKLIFTLGLALLGILVPRASQADDNIPKADILDVVFNEDGTAYDASPMDNKVEVIGKEMMTTYYNEKRQRHQRFHFPSSHRRLVSLGQLRRTSRTGHLLPRGRCIQ